jgi:hypothetical protein
MESAMREYTAKEIQELAKVTKRQLIHWVEVGAIIPLEDDRRRGGKRRFNQQNLIEALICRELNDYRLPSIMFVQALGSLRGQAWKLKGKRVSFWDTLPHREEMPFLIIKRLEVEVSGRPKSAEDIASVVVPTTKERIVNELSVFPSSIVVNLARLVQEAGGI